MQLYGYENYIISIKREPSTLVSLLFLEMQLISSDIPVDIETINSISNNYLQEYLNTIRDNQIKQGLIMCHGNRHSAPIIPDWLPNDIQWSMVDKNQNTMPDFKADYNNSQTLDQLGYEKWDYILEQKCPIHGRIELVLKYVRNLEKLLKPGGELILNFVRTIIKFNLPLIRKELQKERIQQIDQITTKYLNGEYPQVDEWITNFVKEIGYSNYQVNGTYLILIKEL